jgi:hypothetical protein
MTDTELNKALALKIGWREDQIREYQGGISVAEHPERLVFISNKFDYTDWNTIMPIADKYGATMGKNASGLPYAYLNYRGIFHAQSLQKAIALAVINNP